MAHLTPVGGYHIRCYRQTGCTAKLGHHFAAGKTLFCAARIFGVGQNIVQPFTQGDSFIQQPGTVRVNRNTRIREALFQRASGVDFLLARQHTAFEFEIFKAVAILRSLSQTYHRLTVHRLLVTQVIPLMVTRRAIQIRQIGFTAISHVEQIAEHGDRIALLAWP